MHAPVKGPCLNDQLERHLFAAIMQEEGQNNFGERHNQNAYVERMYSRMSMATYW